MKMPSAVYTSATSGLPVVEVVAMRAADLVDGLVIRKPDAPEVFARSWQYLEDRQVDEATGDVTLSVITRSTPASQNWESITLRPWDLVEVQEVIER